MIRYRWGGRPWKGLPINLLSAFICKSVLAQLAVNDNVCLVMRIAPNQSQFLDKHSRSSGRGEITVFYLNNILTLC